MNTESVRQRFENQPSEFYGGNNLQRDGEGYDSSYVNTKWEMYQSVEATYKESRDVALVAYNEMGLMICSLSYNQTVINKTLFEKFCELNKKVSSYLN